MNPNYKKVFVIYVPSCLSHSDLHYSPSLISGFNLPIENHFSGRTKPEMCFLYSIISSRVFSTELFVLDEVR